ncbi:hypothetical protein U1Q18_017769, partial [Sarracenia purpurea var. burkii]
FQRLRAKPKTRGRELVRGGEAWEKEGGATVPPPPATDSGVAVGKERGEDRERDEKEGEIGA